MGRRGILRRKTPRWKLTVHLHGVVAHGRRGLVCHTGVDGLGRLGRLVFRGEGGGGGFGIGGFGGGGGGRGQAGERMAVGAGEQLAGLDHGGELGHGVVVEDGEHGEPTGEVVVHRHVTETVGARAGAGASAARHRGGCSESKKLGLARESKEVVRAG